MCNRIVLPIGLDGVSCVRYMPGNANSFLAVGTNGGKVRLFDNKQEKELCCVYQRRWHKSIRGLAFFPSDPNLLVSVSSQSGIKIHNIESDKRVWMLLKAHQGTPISAVMVTGEFQWATGDENGIVKLWDRRQPGPGLTINSGSEGDSFDPVFSTINDMAIGDQDRKWLYAAVDDGCLAVYNLRRRRLDMVSDSLGYSARAVAVVNNDKHIAVGTEEGVICQFKLGEYEACAERFPLKSTDRSPSSNLPIERIVNINEKLFAVATDDGSIHAVCFLRSQYLGLIGRHLDSGLTDSCGDCLDLSVNPDATILASGCPATRTVSFWPLSQWVKKANLCQSNLKQTQGKSSRKLDLDQKEHLSGLLPSNSDQSATDDSSDSDENMSSDD